MPPRDELQQYRGHIVGAVYVGWCQKFEDLEIARRAVGPCVDHRYGRVAVQLKAAFRTTTLLPASGRPGGAWQLPGSVAEDLAADHGILEYTPRLNKKP